MRKIRTVDTTLRGIAEAKKNALSFREKLQVVQLCDKLRPDVIELPPVSGTRADLLFNKTASANVMNAAVCAAIDVNEKAPAVVCESIKNARRALADVIVPSSPVQMEYMGHRKSPAMLEQISAQVAACVKLVGSVGVTFEDATRAEPEFISEAIANAVAAGAEAITVCDTAGVFLPDEFAAFVAGIKAQLPAEGVALYVRVSDEMSMAAACTAAAIAAGADGVKCTAVDTGCVTLAQIAKLVQVKGAAMGISTDVRTTELTRTADRLARMIGAGPAQSPQQAAASGNIPNVSLSEKDDIQEVTKVVGQLGYDLSEDDAQKVYEAFKRIAVKKQFVSAGELDVIVASTAMQVPSSYRLESYVINSGNVLTATANIALTHNGQRLSSVGVGDGPIDASFRAIEQIIGHRYDMDDFRIQTVTEGTEAMGSALVKLRAGGKLYSGSGISTDIIGASVRAYINALNKIVYEEG